MSPDPLDPVEAALAGEPYLDDDGFTRRVMDRLPGRGPAAVARWAGAAAAAGVAVLTLPGLLAELLAAASAAPTWLPPSALVAAGAALVAGAALGLARLLAD
jgi:hypothetical protein